jgi:hypothetical protein
MIPVSILFTTYRIDEYGAIGEMRIGRVTEVLRENCHLLGHCSKQCRTTYDGNENTDIS